MDEFGRSPNLMAAYLGIPPWAMRLRTFHNLNILAGIVIAVVVAFSQSLGRGAAYASLLLVAMLIVGGIGAYLTRQDWRWVDGRLVLIGSIVGSAVIMVAVNIGLALHFFGIWSP